jgi:hypothetical protein
MDKEKTPLVDRSTPKGIDYSRYAKYILLYNMATK